MADTMKDLVQETINNKDARYVDASDVGEGFATIATVQNVEERKNINGVWISTGRTVIRATVYFDDGTYTRTKSKHVLTTIGRLFVDPVYIDNGFAVALNKKVKFGKKPTLYANGKTYDVLTMDIVEE